MTMKNEDLSVLRLDGGCVRVDLGALFGTKLHMASLRFGKFFLRILSFISLCRCLPCNRGSLHASEQLRSRAFCWWSFFLQLTHHQLEKNDRNWKLHKEHLQVFFLPAGVFSPAGGFFSPAGIFLPAGVFSHTGVFFHLQVIFFTCR